MSQTNPSAPGCPDCTVARNDLSRRELIRRASGAALLGAAATAGVTTFGTLPAFAGKAPAASPGTASETLVAQLYKSFDEQQRKELCFAFDHPLRLKVDNNWTIVKKTIDDALKPDQRDLVRQIFMGLHSPEYAQKVHDQVEHDGGGKGSFETDCAVALFGEPGEKDGNDSKFQFVLTGRHCTRRCDGNSVAGAAFGGPIFYGHAAESFNEKADHKGNAYWFQALRANEVFKALDGKQQKLALLDKARGEQGTKTVELTGKKVGLPGIPLTELTKDQKGLVRKTLDDLLAPFRKADADEAMKYVEAAGIDNLHMAFFKTGDIGNDGVWDVWQIEGPDMLWYFRGAPHVHTWVNIREPAKG